MSVEEQEFAGAWRPEKNGDMIEGEVVEITALDRGWGPYPCVTVRTEAGDRAIHAFHTVLRSELAKRRPRVGDHIHVVYRGKKESDSSANGYHAYQVSGGQAAAYDWGQDLPDGQVDVPIAPSPPPAAQPVTVPDDDDLPFLWRPESWDAAKTHGWSHFS